MKAIEIDDVERMQTNNESCELNIFCFHFVVVSQCKFSSEHNTYSISSTQCASVASSKK